jgi:hypothetical protein
VNRFTPLSSRLIVAAILGIGGSAWAQSQLLGALSSERALLGRPGNVGPVEAQISFRFEGLLDTAELGGNGSRIANDGAAGLARFAWDTAFGTAEGVEVAGRIRLAYEFTDSSEHFGAELAGLMGRVVIEDGSEGMPVSLAFAMGKFLRAAGATTVELSVVTGLVSEPDLQLDIDVQGALIDSALDPALTTAAVGFGPLWLPNDDVTLSLEVQGVIGSQLEIDDLRWEVRGALRIGWLLGAGHEIAVSAQRTFAGSYVSEQTGAGLLWRHSWETDGGLFELDYDDGALPPEPPE